jgi:translocation protein SEC63
VSQHYGAFPLGFRGYEKTECSSQLKIDDISALNAEEQTAEDEISDPEEDTLAGQMAAMRGGAVKRTLAPEDSEDESSTDEEEGGNDSSDSE